jgi:ABC-type uncharacterized transport system YnjBCD substrate-binding protein
MINKEILFLLNKYKNNKIKFEKEYKIKFAEKVKISKFDTQNSEIEITKILTNELTANINTNILIDIIWLNKDNILKNLRSFKLKRILKKILI